MTPLQSAFEQASRDVHALSARPDNATLLRLYALYKQATEGDAQGPRPGFFDFVGTAKHEAWRALAGMPGEDAMREYVELVEQLRTGAAGPP